MNNQLLSPTDIANLSSLREKLKEIVSQAKKLSTPKSYVKKRTDGFNYPDFAYMVEQMDTFHPLRSEDVNIITDESMINKLGVIVSIAKIEDLVTGEMRTGVDAHRITFQKGRDKGIDSVVDIGNDCKSAVTESLRNAYSRFGICADVYQKQLNESTTPAQARVFIDLCLLVESLDGGNDVNYWLQQWKEKWGGQYKHTADEFISKFQEQINQLKEKINARTKQSQSA